MTSSRAIQYSVKVDIHEIKNLSFKDTSTDKEILPNPYVDVTVNGVTKSTMKKNQVASTSFNESFNLSATLTADEFARSIIHIAVLHKYIFQSKIIGVYTFSFSYIYGKTHHWLYRQWVRLNSPDSPADDVGILLITIGIFGPGDPVPVIDESVATLKDGDSTRLNSAPELKVTFYNLNVMIYRGQDIPDVGGISSMTEPYVLVKYGAYEVSTKVLRESNPEWNAQISIPTCLPCHDNNIILELWNGETNGVLINSALLDLFDLIKNELSMRWINFYWRPVTAGVLAAVTDMIATPELKEPNSYGGRLLISASATKVQVPNVKGVSATRGIAEPQGTEKFLRPDIYELSSSSQDNEKVTFEIALGPHSVKTTVLNISEGNSIDELSGRMEEMQVFYPSPPSSGWDFFMYINVLTATNAAIGWFGTGEKTWVRAAWLRVQVEQLLASKGKPQWYNLTNSDGSGNNVYSVLLSVEFGSLRGAAARLPRLEYKLSRYYFRSMLYEGLHLPAIGRDLLPSPYIKVDLAGNVVRTSTIKRTLNPTYYEAYEVEVMMPENMDLAPDINIEIRSEASLALNSDIMLGSAHYPISRVPVEWKRAPEWISLTSNHYIHCKSKVLVAFELVEAEKVEDDTYPFFDDIRPSTKNANISLFLIGIRMFNPLVAPSVTVSFGRDIDNTEEPLWGEVVEKPVAGSGGNWNFLKHFSVNVCLPKRVQHHAILEVIVEDKSAASTFGGTEVINRGTAYISLNPLLPWLNEQEKREWTEQFRLQMLEDVIIEEAELAFKDHNELGGQGQPAAKSAQEKKLKKRLEIPRNDPDSSNSTTVEVIDFIAHEEKTKALLDTDERILRSSLSHQMTLQPADGSGGKAPVASSNTINRSSNLATDEAYIGALANTQAAGIDPKLLNFELKMVEEEELEEEQRDEVPYELEFDFNTEELPYLREPLFRCTDAGVPETVGYIKYVCMVTEEDAEEKKRKMQKHCEWLISRYRDADNLIVRAYILQAKGLVPPSGASDISTYVWISNSEQQQVMPGGFSNNIKDVGNIKRQGFRPEFNRCYQLFCNLPNHALVKVMIMTKGTISDEVIGETFIDVEDRYFNEKIQQMVLNDTVPIELRSLKHEGSTISHGTLRAWFELMTEDFAHTHPTHTLSSSEPDDYQLRIVVWRVKAVPLEDNSQISFFIRSVYQLEGSKEIVKDTDTHYNSKDGTGAFNWRFVFNIKIPAQTPVLKMQIWNYALLKSGEPLGECNFDLSSEFSKARQRGHTIRIPKLWLSCAHPNSKGKLCGAIEIEGSIFSKKESDLAPVGEGRDEPNRDPYLPAIVEHRTYIDWNAVGDTLSAAGGAILSGLKWTGFWLTAGVIVGVIIFLLVILS